MSDPFTDDPKPPAAGGPMPALGFIGAGRLGAGLAVASEAAGFRVAAVASRSGRSATGLAARLSAAEAGSATSVVQRAQVVFLAVPDACIQSVCAVLPWRPGQIVVHASALDGLELLDAARAAGAQRGSFHPLLAFGEPDGATELLRGGRVALDGDPVALEFLSSLAAALQCRPLQVPPDGRVLYHVAAVMSSNYLVTLLDAADRLWSDAGLAEELAAAALAPLAGSALEAVASRGAPAALTGPIVRGDLATVRRHLVALCGQSEDVTALIGSWYWRPLALRCVAGASPPGRQVSCVRFCAPTNVYDVAVEPPAAGMLAALTLAPTPSSRAQQSY